MELNSAMAQALVLWGFWLALIGGMVIGYVFGRARGAPRPPTPTGVLVLGLTQQRAARRLRHLASWLALQRGDVTFNSGERISLAWDLTILTAQAGVERENDACRENAR